MPMTIHTTYTGTGPAIQLCQKEDLDAFDIDWPLASSSQMVKNFVFDERVPYACYVYPPPTSSSGIELVAVKEPTDCATISDVIDMDDQYAPALRYFTLAIAYEKSIEGAVPDRANYYYQLGMAFLRGADAEEERTSPNRSNQEGKITQTGKP